MKRREFLLSAAQLGAMAALAASVRAHASAGQASAPPAKLARVAIMTLNFHALLKLPDQPSSPERTLDVFDLPEMYADTYGVHNLEWQHYHLPATEPSFYKEVRARVDKAKSRVSQVVVEFGGLNVSAPAHNFLPRLQAIDLTKVWIDRCVVLGCPRIMVNQGQLTRENLAIAVETLKAMVAYGAAHGVKVTLETRGGGAGRGATPPAPRRTARCCRARRSRDSHRTGMGRAERSDPRGAARFRTSTLAASAPEPGRSAHRARDAARSHGRLDAHQAEPELGPADGAALHRRAGRTTGCTRLKRAATS